ncbi:YafY family protein [Roseovarius sp. EL26]|uniref:helix-turn-helix transcriptional regulator n=1 Tax=Roseovarius sp. EL26 TaxID=2126672 RepID=UPI0013C41090|nr:YafY family protein [Roseovarius sp. EL26]
MFEIIQLLRRANTPMTAQQISHELEVTKRTIYRDMAALQAMRLPIEGEAGIGYVMRAGFDLPPLMFTQDEIEAIAVGLALLGRIGDPGLERSANSVTAKISDVLPQDLKRRTPLHVSKWNAIPTPSIEARTLRHFIREATELKITYLDLQDQRTEREIKPLALVYYIDAVLLAAWCELRQHFRHFRIDRIEQCTPTGSHFPELSDRLIEKWESSHDLP